VKVGDKVRIIDRMELLKDCEGIIINIIDDILLIDLYKGNYRISESEIEDFYLFFNKDSVEVI
jgi:hypothetical protein